MRLVIGASAGGHTTELLILLAAAKGKWPAAPCACVTTLDIAAAAFREFSEVVYVIGEANRHSPLAAFSMMYRALRTSYATRPDVVITTGSFPLAVFALLCRMMYSSRIVWIDSIAQMSDLSMSGRLMSRFADLCLTQWPDVARRRPACRYLGELL
jgi:UDP-N-acetylglucosamine:LPS N-acetylglucosamine transferase